MPGSLGLARKVAPSRLPEVSCGRECSLTRGIAGKTSAKILGDGVESRHAQSVAGSEMAPHLEPASAALLGARNIAGFASGSPKKL